MDSLELNKAFAAVLLAGMAFVGAGLVGGALVRPKQLAQTAIKIDVPEKGATTVAANVPELPVAVLLASADVGRGEAGVKQQGCVACHNFNDGGKAGIGPNLYGIIGAPHGHQEGYAYSAVLKAKAGPWTYDELSEWLKKPSAYAPGTKMSYAGLADPKKRADIILYLRSLSQSPLALPEAPPAQAAAANTAAPPSAVTAAPTSAPAPTPQMDPNVPIEVRLVSADAKAGQADTMKLGCVACHSYNEGGKAGIGPNMWNVVGAEIGKHMPGYAYSAALQAKGGQWTYEELDKWLLKPAAYAKGTKMTYAGVADPKVRADVIAFLRTLANDPVPLPAAK